MIQLIVKRILLFIPGLFLLLSFCFYISQLAESHPANILLEEQEKVSDVDQEINQKIIEEYKLDLPIYYFSFQRKSALTCQPSQYSNSLLATLNTLAYRSGDAIKTEEFYQNFLKNTDELKTIHYVNHLKPLELEKGINEKEKVCIEWYNRVIADKGIQVNNFIPVLKWHGNKCQFHQWLSHLLSGDMGKSWIDGQDLNRKIGIALSRTIRISGIALLLIFSIGIGLGYYSVKHSSSWWTKTIEQVLFLAYSIPNFWLAGILIFLFTNPMTLDWFPSYGFGEIDESHNWFEVLSIRLPHLVLPLICYSYTSIAIVYSHTKEALSRELQSDYVLTAQSKGLSFSQTLRTHVFKNASFPIVTLLSGVFIFLLSGSFVIEHIFAIPGVGKLTINAILLRDFPTLYALILVFAIATFSGYLLSDVLYRLVDPRLNSKQA